MPFDSLALLPIADVLSSGTPVELGLVITLALAVGGWMVDRHRIGVLERGQVKHEESDVKAHTELRAELAELRREQHAIEADCVSRFADIQRQVDRAAVNSARSGTWQRDENHDDPPTPRRSKS